jgi:DNA-binding MarR family transcriptional regulator
MSRDLPRLGRKPLIALVDRAHRALQSHMVREAHRRGHTQVKQSHNVVFGTLTREGTRSVDMAARAGITRQSMGEVIRDLAQLGIVSMEPDPADGRAKLVRYTDAGLDVAYDGYSHLIELEQRMQQEFGEQEYESVRHFLERLVSILEEERPPV